MNSLMSHATSSTSTSVWKICTTPVCWIGWSCRNKTNKI